MERKPVFRPSFGNRPDQLVGRDEIVGRIVLGLNEYPGSSERATLVLGQRGMGKTALLLEIADRAEKLDYVVARVTCGEAMLDSLIEILQRAGSRFVKEDKKSIKGFSAGALGFSVGLTFTDEARDSFGFRVKLEMICERLEQVGKRVLLLVDEVDPALEQMRTFATTYQELVGDERDIAVVMAGLPNAISSTLNYRTLTFLNRATRIHLDLVEISEVEAYYHSAFARAGIEADAEVERKTAELTGGFPYLIQLLGYYLAKYSEPGKPASLETLSRAEGAALSVLDERVFEAMLHPLSETDINFIRVMAAEMATTLGPIQTSALEKRLGFTHGMFQTYRKRLIDAGIIISPRRGELVFMMPQLEDYLQRTSSTQ